jgi:threonine dehydrogenase-like Zn-dependent dehydrogenase
MPSEMRAACIRGRGQVEVARVPIPEPGPGEVRVAVEACGICGSDLHLFHAGFFPPGTVPGHEAAGRVDALGPGVSGSIATGMRVAVEPMRGCGRCTECQSGLYSICRESKLHGVHLPGGLAEAVVVPADRVHAVPDRLGPALSALAEPMAVVVHALLRGRLARGQRVLVLGAGSIGLLTIAAARQLGAGEVLVVARHPHQAALARALGAARVLAESEADPMALDGIGRETPIDLVVETVGGSADTLRAAGAAVRPGGVVSVVGVFLAAPPIEPLSLMMKEVTLAWSYCYRRKPADASRPVRSEPQASEVHKGVSLGGADSDFAAAVAVLDAERDAIAPLVTHQVPLDRVADAFAVAGDRKAGAIKVSLAP